MSRHLRLACVVSLALLALPVVVEARAQAQDLALGGRRPRFVAAWAPPGTVLDASRSAVLSRRVSLELDRVSLDQALRAIGQQAGVDLTYATAFLPVGKTVSLHVREITVAAALTEVLYETALDVAVSRRGQLAVVAAEQAIPAAVLGNGAIVGRVTDGKTQTALAGATVAVQGSSRSATTGNDGRYRITAVAPGTYTVRARYIGYAPRTASVTVGTDQEATADFGLEKSAQQLDEVVTTGTVVPTEVKALPTPISIVTGDEIERKGYRRVDQIFRGDVPGAVAWDQGPLDFYSSIAIRGASSIASQPSIKTFIDGVEVVSSEFIATIDPNNIERIEITRGPQASTLYGAGALGGVMQIFTKKGQLGLGRPVVTAKLSAGAIGGFDGQGTALQTDNSLAVMGGGGAASYSLVGSYQHVGEWLPSYHSSDWGLSAGGQTTQGPLTLSVSARYADKRYDTPWDNRFQSYVALSRPWYQPYHLRQQTYGVTAMLRATQNWQHTLTIGYDQSYDGYDQTQPRFTTPDDSLLSVSVTHAAQTSLLYHTDLTLRLAPTLAATVTAGVNYRASDFLSSSTFGATRTTGSVDGTTFLSRDATTNTGYFAQAQFNLAERLFLTGGLRAERNPNFGADFGTAWSPRVGIAYLLGHGPVVMKVRGSYGESIRAPGSGERDLQQGPGYQNLANPNLGPERQHGVDGGVDLYLGRASLGVTYYNQRAIDLIDLVLIPTPAGTVPTYQYQNISQVKNDGWEFEGRLPVGPVQLTGTYSIVNSTIQGLPPSYGGAYLVGDRILEIPHTSAGATVSYSPLPQTTVTASMTHLGHWTSMDFVAFLAFAYGGSPYRGSQRAYWTEYPTVTKFAVAVSQVLRQGFTAFVRAENVGNTQRPERHNLNVATPRSLLVGASVRY